MLLLVAGYLAWLPVAGGALLAWSPLAGAGLLSVGELSFWSLRAWPPTLDEPGLHARAAARLALVVAAGAGSAALVVAASQLQLRPGLHLLAMGVVSASGLLALAAGLAWRARGDG